jgi:MFS family permease
MGRTERTYYVVIGLYNLSWAFIGPMYALFLLDRGLDLFQMSVVPAVYWVVSFVFEVPTGAFADLAGRRTSFVISCLVRMLAFGLYAFSSSFDRFLMAEFIDALGSTLANGALEAWAVDSLRNEGGGRPTDRFFVRAQAIVRVAIILSGLAGGYLAQRDLTLPWLAAASAFIVTAAVAALSMREVRPARGARLVALGPLVRTVAAGIQTVRGAPILLLLCGLTFAAAFAVMPMYMLWQPRLQALSGEGVWLMGWVWALLNMAALAGGACAPWLRRRCQRESVLAAAMLWRAASLAMAAVATSFVPVLAGLLLMEAGFGVAEPLMQAWINEHIPSQQRATVLSVRAMFLTLGGGTGLVCIGLIARGSGIPLAWGAAAAMLAFVAPGFLMLARRAQREFGEMESIAVAATGPDLPDLVAPAARK